MRYDGSENVHVTFQNPASSKSKSEADFILSINDAYIENTHKLVLSLCNGMLLAKSVL